MTMIDAQHERVLSSCDAGLDLIMGITYYSIVCTVEGVSSLVTGSA